MKKMIGLMAMIAAIIIVSCGSDKKDTKSDIGNSSTNDSDATNNADAINDSDDTTTNDATTDLDILASKCGDDKVDSGETCDSGVQFCIEIDSTLYETGFAYCKSDCLGWDVNRCVEKCPDNNKFCYEHNGLFWSYKAPNAMNWYDATTYCQNLGGRLPTISELRTLIQNCPATETVGSCGVTDSCLNYNDCWSEVCLGCHDGVVDMYNVFGDFGYFWSSSSSENNIDWAWELINSGVRTSSKSDGNDNVRCVR